MHAQDSLKTALPSVFLKSFTVRDIGEPLMSFDDAAPTAKVHEAMKSHGVTIVGVRQAGRIRAYLTCDVLQEGMCGEFALKINEEMVIDETAPLDDAIRILNRHPLCFIRWLGEIGGIITMDDLQKAPVRMWLFGLVTLIEMRFAELIASHLPGDSWKNHLTPTRLAKAQAILTERRRRGQSPRLFDCLQFADKAKIVAGHEGMRGKTIFKSRRQAEDTTRRLENLRNSLAHAQDIIANDWETIVELSEYVGRQGRDELVNPLRPALE